MVASKTKLMFKKNIKFGQKGPNLKELVILPNLTFYKRLSRYSGIKSIGVLEGRALLYLS